MGRICSQCAPYFRTHILKNNAIGAKWCQAKSNRKDKPAQETQEKQRTQMGRIEERIRNVYVTTQYSLLFCEYSFLCHFSPFTNASVFTVHKKKHIKKILYAHFFLVTFTICLSEWEHKFMQRKKSKKNVQKAIVSYGQRNYRKEMITVQQKRRNWKRRT